MQAFLSLACPLNRSIYVYIYTLCVCVCVCVCVWTLAVVHQHTIGATVMIAWSDRGKLWREICMPRFEPETTRIRSSVTNNSYVVVHSWSHVYKSSRLRSAQFRRDRHARRTAVGSSLENKGNQESELCALATSYVTWRYSTEVRNIYSTRVRAGPSRCVESESRYISAHTVVFVNVYCGGILLEMCSFSVNHGSC